MRTQKRCMGYMAIVVDDYDRAIKYYTDKLGFILVEDTPQLGKLWVVVTPNPDSDCNLLLARASSKRQVFLFLQTKVFWHDYNAVQAKTVHSCQEPREKKYGMVVVLENLRQPLGALSEYTTLTALWLRTSGAWLNSYVKCSDVAAKLTTPSGGSRQRPIRAVSITGLPSSRLS